MSDAIVWLSINFSSTNTWFISYFTPQNNLVTSLLYYACKIKLPFCHNEWWCYGVVWHPFSSNHPIHTTDKKKTQDGGISKWNLHQSNYRSREMRVVVVLVERRDFALPLQTGLVSSNGLVLEEKVASASMLLLCCNWWNIFKDLHTQSEESLSKTYHSQGANVLQMLEAIIELIHIFASFVSTNFK